MPIGIGTIHCNQCGLASASDAGFCQGCGAKLAPHISSPTVQPAAPRYAGFWIRAVADLIDLILLFTVLRLSLMLLGAFMTTAGLTANIPTVKILALRRSVRFVLGVFLGCLYRAGMESSEYQATLGKLAVRIKVTDLFYQRLSFTHATKRYFAKYVSALTLGIGFIMAGFNNRKQALHDKLAETFVLHR